MSNRKFRPAGADWRRTAREEQWYEQGATEPWTAKLIASIVEARQPHHVLETGTFRGTTTMAIAEAMLTYAQSENPAVLLSVEVDEMRAAKAWGFLDKYGVADHPNLSVNIAPMDALVLIRGLAEHSVGLAFLDDDHTAQHVEEEVQALKPKMIRGGMILLHDVVGGFGLDVVVRRHHGIIVDLPKLHAAGGLGIIVVE